MGILNMGLSKIIRAQGFAMRSGARIIDGAGFPKSGTYAAGGTGFTRGAGSGPDTGSIYIDVETGVTFKNEGNETTVYWTPTSFSQQGLMGWDSGNDFGFCDVSGVTTAGKPLADTAAAGVTSRGLKIDGQGMNESDSGLTVALTATDGGGPVGSLVATNDDAHLTQLTVGDVAGTTPVFQPDQNGTIVVDASISDLTDHDGRAFFLGFHGDGTLALDPIMTYATTVITNVGADIVGLTRSSELTDTSSIFHVVFNVTAGGTLTTTNVDTGVNIADAGTYQRMRVEVDEDGTYRCFIAKALVASGSGVDADEELLPSLYIETNDTNTNTLLVSHFQSWGRKVARP